MYLGARGTTIDTSEYAPDKTKYRCSKPTPGGFLAPESEPDAIPSRKLCARWWLIKNSMYKLRRTVSPETVRRVPGGGGGFFGAAGIQASEQKRDG